MVGAFHKERKGNSTTATSESVSTPDDSSPKSAAGISVDRANIDDWFIADIQRKEP